MKLSALLAVFSAVFLQLVSAQIRLTEPLGDSSWNFAKPPAVQWRPTKGASLTELGSLQVSLWGGSTEMKTSLMEVGYTWGLRLGVSTFANEFAFLSIRSERWTRQTEGFLYLLSLPTWDLQATITSSACIPVRETRPTHPESKFYNYSRYMHVWRALKLPRVLQIQHHWLDWRF